MRTLTALSVIAALVFAGAAPADGRTRHIETHIRDVDVSTDFDDRVDQVEGVVEAKADRCIDDRRIAVYADPHGNPRLFGEAKTDEQGEFDVRGTGPTGVDYAIAVFRVRRGGIRCLGKAVVIDVDGA